MSEPASDYDRRNTEERKLAFGHAIAALCNQWSMKIDRVWLPIAAQSDGWETICNNKTDHDGDVTFGEREKGATDGQG